MEIGYAQGASEQVLTLDRFALSALPSRKSETTAKLNALAGYVTHLAPLSLCPLLDHLLPGLMVDLTRS
jgi:hypothetical protein